MGIHNDGLRARMLRENALTLTQAVDLRRSFKQVQVKIKQTQKIQELDKHAKPLNSTSAVKPFKKIACKFYSGKHAYGRNLCPAFGKSVSIAINLITFRVYAPSPKKYYMCRRRRGPKKIIFRKIPLSYTTCKNGL